jgi:prepilin-type N-terminal cleavage/methylation domain-containing protein
MKIRSQSGFSLIELLIVVVIIGIVAAMAVPALRKSVWAAENGTTIATLRSISSTQVAYFSTNSRFGRLTEINPIMGGGIGQVIPPNQIVRGKYYVFEMAGGVPSDADLAQGYTITATRNPGGDTIYKYEMTQSGEIRQILP